MTTLAGWRSGPGPSESVGAGTSAALAVSVTVGSAARLVVVATSRPAPARRSSRRCATSRRSPSTNTVITPGVVEAGGPGTIGPGIGHRADGLLERTSTVVEPLPIQGCTSCGHGVAIPRAAYGGERPDDGIVGPPPSSRVVVHERSKTRITEGRGGHVRQASRAARARTRAAPDPRSAQTVPRRHPWSFSSECDLLAGAVRCQHREVAQPVAELVLGLFVVLRPGVDVVDDERVQGGPGGAGQRCPGIGRASPRTASRRSPTGPAARRACGRR